MEIIRLTPVFKQTLWGGSRMRKEFGYELPGEDTGECWAVSAHKNGDCTVCGGSFDGMRLSQLWDSHRELFGNIGGTEEFPLLTKIIDAKQDLSIQVHPDNAYAYEHENGAHGKIECWYILDCIPDATIVMGHNARTHEELENMIRNGRWKEFIREVPIKKGDFLQIYPGTVHSIKAGTLLLETQQNSDITYRVYDYDRLQNGKLRTLHIEQSIDVITVPFEGSHAKEKGKTLPPVAGCDNSGSKCESLIRCENYEVMKLDTKTCGSYIQDRPFLICSVVDGEGTIKGSNVTERLVKGDHFILPCDFGEFRLEGCISLMCSTVAG